MKGGIGNMMKQAQQLQANLQKAQAEIAAMEVTGESGGGMVKVTINGRHEAKRVQIDPSIPLEQVEGHALRRLRSHPRQAPQCLDQPVERRRVEHRPAALSRTAA
jgi:hypothetical protein